MTSERSVQRIASWVHRKVATLLLRDIRDPRMGFLTITRVKVSRDLETATIYYSVLGNDKEKRQAARLLDHAAAYIQREIGSGLHTRVTPKIHFEFDESVEGGVRMSKLLNKISDDRSKRDSAGGEEPKNIKNKE
ncbi:MAG: 30S ribosome-binding factor RbfA [Planctomycetes bacterium]|nr:30S ribosome-binding factor RbfA [Planctomycetota bacterium]